MNGNEIHSQEIHSNNQRSRTNKSISDLLTSTKNQRFEQLIQIYGKKIVIKTHNEGKAIHRHFRRTAADPITFYQHNGAIFQNDIEYEYDPCIIEPHIYSHGDLHVRQFQCYYNDIGDVKGYRLSNYQKVVTPFSWDLKRLGTNLSLIAYSKGFSDAEIIEILDNFVQQYIETVSMTPYSEPSLEMSIEKIGSSENDIFIFQWSNSTCSSYQFVEKSQEIQWNLVDSVASFMTLSGGLAKAVGLAHCYYDLPDTVMAETTNHLSQRSINRYSTLISATLSSVEKQETFIEDIRHFSMIYAEIVRRDHKMFFKNFRNAIIFKGTELYNDPKRLYPFSHTSKTQVLIVGGGIGGLATALAFAKAGISVKLVEKNSNFRELGAGMQLAPNCSRILDRLGILEEVQARAFFPKQIIWTDALTGERLTRMDLGPKFIEQFEYPYIVVHRVDLLNTLYEACIENPLVTLEVNCNVVSVEERPQTIIVECSNGMRYECKMVVAADGLWSSLRKFVCDDGDPHCIGYVTYRGTIPFNQIETEEDVNNVQFWIGPDIHIVQYPVRRGELINLGAVFKSRRFPNDTDEWGTKEELNDRFSIGCDEVKKMLLQLQTNFRWPVYDRNPINKWSRGRVVLLGDAAHPMLQYAAQGAAQALEDAWAIAIAYKKHGPSDIPSVFYEYEQERIPRASQIVQFARDIGRFAHQDGGAKELRDAMLRIRDMHDFEFIKWLYGKKDF